MFPKRWTNYDGFHLHSEQHKATVAVNPHDICASQTRFPYVACSTCNAGPLHASQSNHPNCRHDLDVSVTSGCQPSSQLPTREGSQVTDGAHQWIDGAQQDIANGTTHIVHKQNGRIVSGASGARASGRAAKRKITSDKSASAAKLSRKQIVGLPRSTRSHDAAGDVVSTPTAARGMFVMKCQVCHTVRNDCASNIPKKWCRQCKKNGRAEQHRKWVEVK